MTLPLALLLSALSGLVALSSEIVWYRVWSFAAQGTASAFGALLGFYLLGLAAGSYAGGRLCGERDVAALGRVVRGIALAVLLASLLGFLVTPAVALATRLGLHSAALPLVALATTLMGAVFPFVSHAGVPPDERVGPRVSYLQAANIAGSATGSLVTGFVLMDLWTLRTIATAVALAGLALALGVLLIARPSRRELGRGAALVAAAVLAVVGFGPALYRDAYEKMQLGPRYDPARPFAHVVETRSGVITVTADGEVFGGGAYDGHFKVDLREDRNGIYRAFALGAFVPAPRRVLMIGLASGSWARVVAAFRTVERLTIVEINPGYLELMKLYPGGEALLANPKVRIVVDDGRRWLQRHPDERFDLVVQNTTWHWRAHITDLLSREYLELVRTRLAPGGVFYYNTTHSPEAQKTALVVYPFTLRVGNFVAVSDAPLVFDKRRWRNFLTPFRFERSLLFDPESADDRAFLEQVLARADDVDGTDPHTGLETRAHLLARLAGREIVTDDNMRVEWR
jgi:spermidine synthase